MRCIKLLFVCIFIFPGNNFSQENLKYISTRDSSYNINSKLKEELQFKNFFRSSPKKLMGKDDLSGLTLYGKAINDSFLVIEPYNLNLNNYSKEELAYFKETFQQLMEIAKKNHYKYYLGEVGKYLGISRKILAIILAIISVAK